MYRWIAVHCRIVRQGERMHPLPGHTRDFCGRGGHVPPRDYHQRYKTSRCSVAPILQMPVVIGLNDRERDFAVRNALKSLARKPRKCRKAQGAKHSIDIHVVHPGFYIPGAAAHVLIGERFHAVFFLRPPDDGIKSHIACGAVLEYPDVAALPLLYDGFTSLEAGRHVTCKGIGRFDHMIVHTNENQVIELHLVSHERSGDWDRAAPKVTFSLG